MCKSDFVKTQHFSDVNMISNLLKFIPYDADIIEPFVGAGDLILPDFNYVEWYDIDPSFVSGVHLRDTLLDTPDYNGKYVITNPPYLARNKAVDKEIFISYGVNDLYKAAIKSLMNCNGSILIIPFNFFTGKDNKVRESFFRIFKIEYINIFNNPMFENTTTSVCSFAFSRKDKVSSEDQNVKCLIFDKDKEVELSFQDKYGYRLGGSDLSVIENIKPVFCRLLEGQPSNTNIKIYCLDTRYESIRATVEEPFYGKISDRTYLTLQCSVDNLVFNENRFCKLFNNKLNDLRVKYYDLIFSVFRDFGRKRVSFNFVYKLATIVLHEMDVLNTTTYSKEELVIDESD